MAGGGVIRGSVQDQWGSASGIKGQRDKTIIPIVYKLY